MSKREEKEVVVPASAPLAESAYEKAQFLVSSRYTPAQRDILAAVLEDGKSYTDNQAKQALETYLRKELK
ncbi:hypothetical protein AWU65_07140 [Paenibacillus glucanolyticus]|uniref:Uncharacterized protein n=1 Tax=Paenibacillus glucanolyticus TaxID=59843 RepID=A0A163HX35_9BACL|nr:hypothetical protein [Paenibacillus glucanolyticus]KZS45703.1 hypothetical protein AWU65_07140 [Paenibacillus glucanolyticus]